MPQSKFLFLIKGKWVQLTFRLECQNFFLINQLLTSGCKTRSEIFNLSKAHGGIIYTSWSFKQMMRISATLHYRLPTVNFLFDWILFSQELPLAEEIWTFVQSYKWLPDFIHYHRNIYSDLTSVIKIIKLIFSFLKDVQDSITWNQVTNANYRGGKDFCLVIIFHI